ncbi:unnamed protein product, partial [marine sediment metagenome]
MKHEELEEFLKSLPDASGVEWINFDEHGFSRDIKFEVFGKVYLIEWYHNACTLNVGSLLVPFEMVTKIY